MKKFVKRVDIELEEGLQINKDSIFTYENDNVKQELDNLELKIHMTEKKDLYESETDLTIHLKEGDILLFDKDKGYYLPTMPMSTVETAIEDLESIKDIANKGV